LALEANIWIEEQSKEKDKIKKMLMGLIKEKELGNWRDLNREILSQLCIWTTAGTSKLPTIPHGDH